MNRDYLAEDTLRRYVLPLVSKVRDEDPEAWGPWIQAIPVDRLRVAAVLLAALVPVDASVSELTAWMRIGPDPVDLTEEVDGELIDLVAVERALSGRERIDLSRTEKKTAVRVGTDRGMSMKALAERLGMDSRTVSTYRREAAA